MGREKILKVHMRKVPLAADVDARVIARGTPGFSGADLANLVNEAALLAARRGKRVVAMSEFEAAKDKVLMGAERRSMVMSEKEKETTAYHEGGHALVALYAPGHDPLHKVTIIPRGRALGVTMSLPEKDRYGFSRQEIEAKLAMMFGGRVAEELIYGAEHVTTGAADDIRQATNLARRMVTEWGMSDKLGRLRYSENEEEVFLGHSVTQRKNVSDATAKIIDDEIRRIIDEAEQKAHSMLTEHIDQLHAIAKALLEYETLSGDEIKALIRGEPIYRDTDQDTPKPSAPPPTGRRASVPPSGTPDPGPFEPKPQPGARRLNPSLPLRPVLPLPCGERVGVRGTLRWPRHQYCFSLPLTLPSPRRGEERGRAEQVTGDLLRAARPVVRRAGRRGARHGHGAAAGRRAARLHRGGAPRARCAAAFPVDRRAR